MLKPIKLFNLQYEYYHIDEKLESHFDFSILRADEPFLYTNYFGLKDEYIKNLPHKYNTVIENCQTLLV